MAYSADFIRGWDWAYKYKFQGGKDISDNFFTSEVRRGYYSFMQAEPEDQVVFEKKRRKRANRQNDKDGIALLIKHEKIFSYYAELHRAKQTMKGDEAAQRNAEYASEIRDYLSRA